MSDAAEQLLGGVNDVARSATTSVQGVAVAGEVDKAVSREKSSYSGLSGGLG